MKRIKLLTWIIWIPTAIFCLFMVFLQTSMSIMIPELKESFKLNSFGIGLLSASFYYTYATMQVPIGTLVDKFGVKKIFLLSVAGTALSCIGFALSKTFLLAALSRVLMGFSCASAITCAFYVGVIWFPSSYFSLVAGLSEAMAVIGGAFSTKLLAPSVKTFGWRMTFVFCFIFSVLLFIAGLVYVKDRRKNLINNKHPARKINIYKNLLIVLNSRIAWLCGIYAGFLFLPLSVVGYLWGVQFVMTGYSLSLEKAATAIAVIFIGAALGNPLIAVLTEKYDIRKQMMIFCAFAELVLIIVFIYFPVLKGTNLYILLFLIGILSTSYLIPYSIAKDSMPRNVCATAIAFINVLCGCIGSLLFQPLTGWILSFTAEYSKITTAYIPTASSFMYALAILPLCFLISIFLVFMIFKKNNENI